MRLIDNLAASILAYATQSSPHNVEEERSR